MNRAAFIEKLTEVQRTIEQLLAQLQASEHDKFAAHRAGKGNKQIDAVADLGEQKCPLINNPSGFKTILSSRMCAWLGYYPRPPHSQR
jgi:hypothetical protein